MRVVQENSIFVGRNQLSVHGNRISDDGHCPKLFGDESGNERVTVDPFFVLASMNQSL